MNETGEGGVLRVSSKAEQRRYVSRGGVRCLYCGSEQLEGGSVEIDAGTAWQQVGCSACGGSWRDVYRLVSVEP